jgi:hypothetical protein
MRATLAFTILFTALVAALVFAGHLSQRSVRDRAPASVILASRGAPQNVGQYGEFLAGLTTAESQEQLELLVNESTNVIVIDRSIAAELSSDFLRLQLARGVYIFGLNLSERELKTLTDWPRAYELAGGRPGPFSSPESWAVAPSFPTFFTYTHIGNGGRGGGLGRLDIHGGLFQARLARAAGIICRDGVVWSDCNPDSLAQIAKSNRR